MILALGPQSEHGDSFNSPDRCARDVRDGAGRARDAVTRRRGVMRKLMLKMSISMDGFCADSDPNGPQKWLFDTSDDESNAWEISFLKDVGYHAMGHNTYQVMAGFWPVAVDPFSNLMNSIPKLIFTREGLDRDHAARCGGCAGKSLAQDDSKRGCHPKLDASPRRKR